MGGQQLFGTIMFALFYGGHIRGMLHTLPIAKEIWDTVHNLYSDADNLARIYHITQEIKCIRQGESLIIHYY